MKPFGLLLDMFLRGRPAVRVAEPVGTGLDWTTGPGPARVSRSFFVPAGDVKPNLAEALANV